MSGLHRAIRLGAAFLLLGAMAAMSPRAWSAESASRERLIYRFDFEERGQGNFEDLPMHWYPIGRVKEGDNPSFGRLPLHQELMARPGFPVYTEVRFDDRCHTSGKASLYLGLNAGSAGAFLEVGAVPIVPRSDYLVTANVRTSVLEHARARLVAYFVDDQGRRIDDSIAVTDMIRTDNRWDAVSVRLHGDFAKAAWIGMEVQLLQPGELADSPLGKHQVVYKEMRGGAWFDDIAIWQLPRVTMTTQSSVNIIRAPQQPQLSMEVHDLSGRELLADVVIYDHRMRPVATRRQTVGDGAAEGWHWTPTLPGLGWYYADMKVREPGSSDAATPAARAHTAFLWLGDAWALGVPDATRFSIESEDVPDDELALLPELFDVTALDAAVVSCWSRQTTLAGLESRQARLDQFLEAMLLHGRAVTLSLTPVPRELARSLDIDRDSPLGLFNKPEAAWISYLAPILLRNGQRVRHWQLGSTRQPDAFFVPDLPSQLAVAQREFQSLAPQPDLLLPWRLDQARRTDLPAGTDYAIDIPDSIRPEYLGDHLKDWATLSDHALRLNLRVKPATEAGHQSRIDDLAKRMLYAWEAVPATLSLDHPWTVARNRSTELAPDPLLGVFAQVAHMLAGRRVVGRLSLGPGIECMILDGPAGGMLAAWNASASLDEGVIDLFLGPSPAAFDLFGNKTDVPLLEGRHHLTLGRSPRFITGIDPALALFRASMRLTDPFVESTQAGHERGIVISNPWPRTVSGYMLVTQPQAWRIEPRRTFFSIAAGQTTTIPVELAFPASEVAGRKNLVARFDFSADQHYIVDVSVPMELGLRDIDFDSDLAIEPNPRGGRDAIVTQQITNAGAAPAALYAFANMPGHPRQERIIARLKPGQSIIRRFRFDNVGDEVGIIHVGLRETAGPAVLNKIIDLPGR